jgi:endonuclease YncB( thermonuclease family)
MKEKRTITAPTIICIVVAAGSICVLLLPAVFQEVQKPVQTPVPHIERIEIVSYVIDGDTIALRNGERVRLVGIDTPELWPQEEPGGREAKEYVESLCPPGTQVGLDVDDSTPRDRYGRTLAIVYVKIDESWVNLNEELLRKGYAEPYLL